MATGALLVSVAVLKQQGDPPVPDPTAGLAAVQTPTPQPSEAGESSPSETAPSSSEHRSAPTATTSPNIDPLPAAVPVSVEIPDIGVSSLLHPLGLNPDGTLQVPSGDRYDEAAWFEGSPTPGEMGPSVIEGHVTGMGFEPSVFFNLGALERGDLVEVSREDGSVAVFEVYATDKFPKDAFPTDIVYGDTAAPELRLITCGGAYDPQADAHVDNVVVFARLVDSA